MPNKQDKETKLIWLVGGGTGGHVVALFPVAAELKKDKHLRLMYIGGGHNTLESKLAKEADIPFKTVPYGKFRRYITLGSIIANVGDAVKIAAGVLKSYGLIKRYKPALIFSKGGPVALPVALAAWLTGTCLITHESDTVMGVTNRWIGTFACQILTAFPASYYPLRYAKKIIAVGLPIRPEFCRPGSPVKKQPPTVVIMGGSQGSRAINLVTYASLPRLLTSMRVVHITGDQGFVEACSVKVKLGNPENYEVIGFTPEVARYMKEATLLVVRASSTIFEAASLHKPMLLIPLPSAAGNHQVKNAEAFVQAGAAVMVRQESLTPEMFCEKIEQILRDKVLQARLQKGTAVFASCQTAQKVADSVRHHLISS